MPNDPRHKFKKQVYDMSRNIFYEQRTGGGGAGFPSGGGGGGGPPAPDPQPKPKPDPDDPPYVPPNVDPYDPYGPFKPAILPFDPYQRRLIARADEARLRIEAEENERLKVRPIVKSNTMDRGKSGVLDDMLPVADDFGPVPKGASGQFPPAKNQFGLKFKINPIDQPPAKITKDLVPASPDTDLQKKVEEFQKMRDKQNKLTSDRLSHMNDRLITRSG
jgi:hypothetical protein